MAAIGLLLPALPAIGTVLMVVAVVGIVIAAVVLATLLIRRSMIKESVPVGRTDPAPVARDVEQLPRPSDDVVRKINERFKDGAPNPVEVCLETGLPVPPGIDRLPLGRPVPKPQPPQPEPEPAPQPKPRPVPVPPQAAPDSSPRAKPRKKFIQPENLPRNQEQLYRECIALHDGYKDAEGAASRFGSKLAELMKGIKNTPVADDQRRLICFILGQQIDAIERHLELRKKYIGMNCDMFEWQEEGHDKPDTTEQERREKHVEHLQNAFKKKLKELKDQRDAFCADELFDR